MQNERKIQLVKEFNFFSSKNFKETGTMHTKSINIDIMIGSTADEIMEKLFESLL